MLINSEEAIKCQGGGKISIGLVTVLTAIGSFILGLIDGYTNPKACNIPR